MSGARADERVRNFVNPCIRIEDGWHVNVVLPAEIEPGEMPPLLAAGAANSAALVN